MGAVNEESEVKMLLQNEINLRKAAEEEINILRNQLSDSMPSEVWSDDSDYLYEHHMVCFTT